MTAMNLYLAQSRMRELRASRAGAGSRLDDLLHEIAEVLRGALMPVPRPGVELGEALRRDLGMR